jgi:capsular polysaccharide transport system permease protein
MGRHLIIGDSLLIFLTTGVAPVLYFRSISIRTAGAIASSTHLMTIPYIQPLDCAIARAGIEVISFILLFAAFLAGINIFGLSRFAIPYNFEPIIISLTCLTLTAFGFGLLNAYFIALFPLWKFLWSAISRCQIFYSGVFFIPEYMPPQLRRFLVYSPMMQFVSLFRTGFYPSYPTHLISISYIVWFTIAILFLGLGLERLWRGRALR